MAKAQTLNISPWLIVRIALVLALFAAFVPSMPKPHSISRDGGTEGPPAGVDYEEWASGAHRQGVGCSMMHQG